MPPCQLTAMNVAGSPWGNTARRHRGAGSGRGEGECNTEPFVCTAISGLCNCGDGKIIMSALWQGARGDKGVAGAKGQTVSAVPRTHTLHISMTTR